ncbi:MAG: glutamine synthetase [Bacteroidales bacterium]|nr:glutamine synthetase [Bacteroidales bacterium]MDT3361814.1 glutamine synthetase family protein [Bacteroidota bacterium]
MEKTLELNPNAVVAFLKKKPVDFTREDLIKFIKENNIRMIDFMYPAEDGRVKTLNFVINNLAYAETILTEGERVDGSSLFPSFVEAGNSDLYVLPRYRTAFVNPFSEIPTLCFLCSFFDKDGSAFACAPYQTLMRAAKVFRESTGMTFEAMGELEYYVITDEDHLFPATDQRGYHESGPFAKLNEFRRECMDYVAKTGGQIKYGHSEVGNFCQDGKVYEQNEIEFLPNPVETAADQLLLAKWVIRNLAYEYGLDVCFAPKITVGKAGSGMHIHMRLMKDGKNATLGKDGKLSDEARRAIAGLMLMAPAITAFGNKNPTSYFRLVPHQEAPTNVCWGDCNRSALVRVPLGWSSGIDMCHAANPQQPSADRDTTEKQTFEMRSPDCSADIYQLMAGLCVAAREGLELPVDDALKIAADKYVDMDIHKSENAARLASLDSLPVCCSESADCLQKQRAVFEAAGVFEPRMIDGIIKGLKSFDDKNLHERAKADPNLMRELVEKYFYCG